MPSEQPIFADVVIAGAGHAGGAAALALCELGFTGTIALVGAEQYLPYQRPPLSKDALQVPDWRLEPIASAEALVQQSIDTYLGEAVIGANADARLLTLTSGRSLTYGALVIATGAAPRRMAGPSHPGRFVLRGYDDAMAIKRATRSTSHVVVVGGGPIGLEAAAALRPHVAEVTIVEAAPRLMARCAPADVAAVLAALHEAHGVRILLSSPVSCVTPAGEGLAIGLQSGEALHADLVIEGLGVTPETHLANMLGLPVADGILVNDVYQTEDPSVYAIGDCACPPGGRQETWSHAESSARAAARSLMALAPLPAPTLYFWTDQYGSRLQVAGKPLGTIEGGRQGQARLYTRDGIVTAVAALDAPRDFAAARRLIGRPASDQSSNQRPPIASVTARQL